MQSDTSPLEVWKTVSKSWKLLNREAEKALSATGLSLAEVRILYALRDKGPLPITKLTDEIIVTPGAMTSLVDGLEQHKHLVERSRIGKDRRVVTISITQKGKKELDKALVLYRRFIKQVFQRLSKKEMILLFELMEKLTKQSSA